MNKKTNHETEHGTTMSYVVGFILSLLFTLLPYHLVVNKVMTGNKLLITILAIAVIQMAIQLLFFLHLGRGPKPLYNVVFFFATAGVILLTIGASLFIMDNLYRNMSPTEIITRQAQEENISQIGGRETGACTELGASHVVTISGSEVRPDYIETERCDTLTFIGEKGVKHEIAFGNHSEDVSYGGNFEVIIENGRSETITLNEVGDFIFHDHLDPNMIGHFSVVVRE